MKSQLVIYPAMLAMLFTACDENKVDATEDSIEAQNEMNGAAHEEDTSMVKRDGTLLPGAVDQIDSLSLPASVTTRINKDAILSKEQISGTRRFTENGTTYYEVKFHSKDGQIKTIVYDENGTINPSN